MSNMPNREKVNIVKSQKISSAEYIRRQLEHDAERNRQMEDGDLGNISDMHKPTPNDLANRKISVSSVNSDIERREIASKERQPSKNAEEGRGEVNTPSKNDRIKSYQKSKEAILKAAKARIQGRKENRSSLNAMSSMIIFTAFAIAISSDLLDIFLDGTIVGYPFSLFANFVICPLIGFLWWSLGVDSSNNRLRKGGRRAFVSLGVETVIDFFPTLIIWCCINLLDYLGYLDNKDWLKTLNKNRAKNILPLDS